MSSQTSETTVTRRFTLMSALAAPRNPLMSRSPTRNERMVETNEQSAAKAMTTAVVAVIVPSISSR